MTPRLGPLDHLLGALLGALYLALLVVTAPDIGMSRDEGFYVRAAQDYARWMELFAEDREEALTPEAIERGWTFNHEHPGLIKSLFALNWLWHESARDEAAADAEPGERPPGLYGSDSLAFRFPGMVSAALLLWLLYVFGARVFGRPAGAFAAVAYALMPRPFYHAHLDCFDVPITLALTFVVYAYWRSLRSRAWAVVAGLAFGLALATKHNAWTLPPILLIHFVWMSWSVRRRRRAGERIHESLSTRPWWLLSMALLGPPIFVLTWPWLWDAETILPRLGFYIRFHLSHEYYNMVYFGETYFEPPFPVGFPFVLTLFTVPLTTLALAGVGLARRSRALLPHWLATRVWKKGEVQADPAHTDVLLFGCLLAPLVVIALPSSPIFGGTKHWFPAYPFLAMYAGFGFVRVAHAFRHSVGARLPRAGTSARLLVTAMLLVPLALETYHSHPFGLSHYTPIAGGVPGAADHGMNRQFWGFTTRSLTDFFREEMPEGGRVYLCDTTPGAWAMLQRDGHLPRNIRGIGDVASADFVMVHHEHHFAEVDYQAWAAFGSTRPAHVLTLDGVPIVTVYENPSRRTPRGER